jgi:alpha-amylase
MQKGYVTEFRYCSKIASGIEDYGQLSNLIDYGWGMARSDRAFIFTDNHDNQRGHGGGGKWSRILCTLLAKAYINSIV